MDMLRFLIFTLTLVFTFNCKDKSLPLPFGAEIRIMPVDTIGKGNIDTNGYYIAEKDNYRVIYIEIDKNGNGSSDEFIWQGHATSQNPNEPAVRTMVKVHEEVDENNDGKVDLIRWLLPNELIALTQKDSNHDGYFETTQYYNLRKRIVRREIDTGKGFPTIFIFSDRAEIDTNGDRIPDQVVLGTSDLMLEEKAMNLRDAKPLKADDSVFLNPKLLPQEERPILGSGMN
jgi:hypothetical protein